MSCCTAPPRLSCHYPSPSLTSDFSSCSFFTIHLISFREMPKALKSRELYTVGWIAALPKELSAAIAMFDEQHDKPLNFEKHALDSNSYHCGCIGNHNVVVACLPHGIYGTTSAATTASSMLFSFPNVKVGLMVGIGAAIPSDTNDIRLGDVVVSLPHGSCTKARKRIGFFEHRILT